MDFEVWAGQGHVGDADAVAAAVAAHGEFAAGVGDQVDAGAVVEALGVVVAGCDVDWDVEGGVAESLELFFDDVFFPGALGFESEVSEFGAADTGGAGGFGPDVVDAVGVWFEDGGGVGAPEGVFGGCVGEGGGDVFAGGGVAHEDDTALVAGDAVAAMGGVFDGEFDSVADLCATVGRVGVGFGGFLAGFDCVSVTQRVVVSGVFGGRVGGRI